jgi:hypothetical protein
MFRRTRDPQALQAAKYTTKYKDVHPTEIAAMTSAFFLTMQIDGGGISKIEARPRCSDPNL